MRPAKAGAAMGDGCVTLISEEGGYSPVPWQEGCQYRRRRMFLQVGNEPMTPPVTGLRSLPVTSAALEIDQVLALSSHCLGSSLMLNIRSRLTVPPTKVEVGILGKDWPSWPPPSGPRVGDLGEAPGRS